MSNCPSEICITLCFHITAETHFPILHHQFGGKIWYFSNFSLNFGNLHGEKLYSIIVLACISFITNQVPHFFLIFSNFFSGYFSVFWFTSRFSSIGFFILFSYFNFGLCVNEVNESFVSYLPNIFQLSFYNSLFIVYSAMQEFYYKESYVNFPF